MVSDFRMSPPATSIEASIEDNSPANTGSHSHANEATFALCCSSPHLAKRGSIGIVFHDRTNPESLR